MRRIAPLSLLLLVVVAASCARAPAFREAKLREIDLAIQQAIAAKRIPGAVLWIEHRGAVYHRAYGNRALVPRVEAMTADTVFDVASLTKPVATAPSIWLLIRQGKVALDAPAARYLPEIADRRITVRHLLTHSSGLRPGLDLEGEWSGYDEGVRRALAEIPRNAPGAIFRYSDVNFILLGEIVHRVSGQPLDQFAREHVFAPLRMSETGFRRAATAPAASPRRFDESIARIAPTENGLRGTVHDPTARRMGGVAGHAGVFTTAADLARFARAVLAGKAFPREMTAVQSPPAVAIKRAGGFDVDSGYARPRGELFPVGSFGHTGWTGAFLWIDPSSQAFYVSSPIACTPTARAA